MIIAIAGFLLIKKDRSLLNIIDIEIFINFDINFTAFFIIRFNYLIFFFALSISTRKY